MTTLNSYRVLSTNTTAGLMCASALVAYGAIAEAYEAQVNPAALVAPVNVFEPAKTDGSRAEATSSLPFDYKVTQPFQLSEAAVRALGVDGVDRLERFRKLRANWDGEGARTLDGESMEAFSQFFRDTGLHPDGLAVFMSREGNVTVNWLDESGGLIELEFSDAGVHFFVEGSGEEGVATAYAVATFLTSKVLNVAA
jgi:hypothetical protein